MKIKCLALLRPWNIKKNIGDNKNNWSLVEWGTWWGFFGYFKAIGWAKYVWQQVVEISKCLINGYSQV